MPADEPSNPANVVGRWVMEAGRWVWKIGTWSPLIDPDTGEPVGSAPLPTLDNPLPNLDANAFTRPIQEQLYSLAPRVGAATLLSAVSIVFILVGFSILVLKSPTARTVAASVIPAGKIAKTVSVAGKIAK
jgi:hypothetical protein